MRACFYPKDKQYDNLNPDGGNFSTATHDSPCPHKVNHADQQADMYHQRCQAMTPEWVNCVHGAYTH